MFVLSSGFPRPLLTTVQSYTLRMALIQVCGNLIQMLSQQYVQEPSEDLKRRMKTLLEVLEERFRDLNPYCRCRVMQVYIKLCDMEWTWPKQRQTVAHLTALSLKDKSSHVRRNAIKLMVKLVNTNLFNREGDCLAIGPWMKKLSETEAQIAALEPQLQEGEEDADEQTVDATLLQEATQIEVPKNPDDMTDEERLALEEKLKKKFATEQMLAVLQKTRKFLVHGLRFIEIVNEAAEMVMLLLSSKNKNEVIDAMDFFTVMDYFKIQNARAGIRKMLRLIWTKGNSDEGKGVQTHLIDCYRNLFFDAPPNFTPNDAANYISRNMMSLTYGTTPAELTSLEQLLSTMMKQGFVNELVIQKLWQVYGYQKRETSKSQRRGAIIVLGMLALADPNIIKNEMDTCLRIGLGELGRRDLVLARYTCVALSRISPPPAKQQMQTAAPEQVIRLPHEHPILLRLAAITELVSDSKEWFGVAEQAISAIYVLAKNPDVFCSNILRRKTKYVFSPSTFSRPTTSGSATTTGSVPPTQDAAGDVEMQDAPVEDVQMEEASAEPPEPARPSKTQNPAIALSQLLFIVGHVAIKQIVHLGLCEEEHNRREAEKKKKKPTPRNSAASEVTSGRGRGRGRSKTARIATPGLAVDDELDLMAGGDQDEFRDKIERVREEELLYGYNSLLARYGPLVAKICANKAAYNHPTLQAQAALCLAKFMCVSKQYCKENLILFLRLVQGSKDAVVRSNLVIGLGDVIICFEELVEEYMPLLYERLTDRESSVKRTCLMTLSFLMLASRVKVGGRELGNIAKCLEDDDPIFVEMARTFFSELATKDKAVYGNFQNTFQLLSADTTLSEEAFRRIIKYIAGFIEKVCLTF